MLSTESRAQSHAGLIAAVEALRADLIAVSSDIHAHPETAFQEFYASGLLCDRLEAAGFAVERGLAGLATAFRGTLGDGAGPTIALLAEYDALPEIGHACGHNIMGTAALGAALAYAAARGTPPGRLLVVGTPAEEGGGGKQILVDAGLFAGVDAALIVHPSTRNFTRRGSLASTRLDLEFFGRAAHASTAPEAGVNALEAVLATFNHANALRQHLRADARIHGIITHGGAAVNIVPDYAAAKFSVRAADRAYMEQVLARFLRGAEAAALATGARLAWRQTTRYDNMVPNLTLADRFADHLRALGLKVREPGPETRMGSTDMGNVSQVVPAIHPYIAIAPPTVNGHTPAFRDAAVSERGHAALIAASQALALTVADLFDEPALLTRIQAEFAEQWAQGVVRGGADLTPPTPLPSQGRGPGAGVSLDDHQAAGP